MRFEFPVYPDNELTTIAQRVIAAAWLDDHDSDEYSLKTVRVQDGNVVVHAYQRGLTLTTIHGDYTAYVENHLNNLN